MICGRKYQGSWWGALVWPTQHRGRTCPPMQSWWLVGPPAEDGFLRSGTAGVSLTFKEKVCSNVGASVLGMWAAFL